jgi:hypothetical protein
MHGVWEGFEEVVLVVATEITLAIRYKADNIAVMANHRRLSKNGFGEDQSDSL